MEEERERRACLYLYKEDEAQMEDPDLSGLHDPYTGFEDRKILVILHDGCGNEFAIDPETGGLDPDIEALKRRRGI